MRRLLIIFLLICSVCIKAGAQSDEEMDIERYLGTDMENADSEEVERLSAMLRRPVNINLASEQELVSTALFSRYQIASLMDYRKRSGAVLSFMELASLDGFGDNYVSRIRPFLALNSSDVSSDMSCDSELTLRTAVKDTRYSYAARYSLEVGDVCSASVGLTRSLDSGTHYPDAITFHLGWESRSLPLKLIAGDFNARFGQGLLMWNGLMMNNLSSPSVFMRRPSGITPSRSFTGNYSNTGLSCELQLGRFIVSAMTSVPGIRKMVSKPTEVGLLPALNVTFLTRNGQVGISHYTEFSGLHPSVSLTIPSMKTSTDMAFCFKGVDVFSELCYEWVERSVSGLAGTVFPAGESLDLAAVVRFDRKEYAMAMSGELNAGRWMVSRGSESSERRLRGTLSADFVHRPQPKDPSKDYSFQAYLRTQWTCHLSESWLLSLRMTERIRNSGNLFRTDVRMDVGWHSERFSALCRLNVLNCVYTSFLTYVEGSFKNKRFACHLRQGMFMVDDWNDRIYVYERDAPGCFNVPAFYGRGLWTSLVTSWRFSRMFKLYLRGGYTSYAFMNEKKPGKAELRLQCVVDF